MLYESHQPQHFELQNYIISKTLDKSLATNSVIQTVIKLDWLVVLLGYIICMTNKIYSVILKVYKREIKHHIHEQNAFADRSLSSRHSRCDRRDPREHRTKQN